MSNQPEPKSQDTKHKLNKDVLLGVIAALFVVAAIAAMVAIDVIADAKMGGARPAQDAAEK